MRRTGLRASPVVAGRRCTLGAALGSAFLGLVSLAVLGPAGAVQAGPCVQQTRQYCVQGTSTPLDWTWEVDGTSSTVLAATNNLLSPGDPAADIVALFVSELNPPFSATVVSPPECFELASCTPLSINGMVVPQAPMKLTFNPIIVQILPEPSLAAMLAAGVSGLAWLERRRVLGRR